jgi:RNA-directed DNA polymerase
VEGAVWDTPRQKGAAVAELRPRGYRPQPRKRKGIPKKEGRVRYLGIPTLYDRAMPALYAQTLDPLAETQADLNSDGFRRERSAADAIEQCFGVLARKTSAAWVLEGDIQGCFDHISHEWLESHIPIPKDILRKWLKAGYIEQGRWNATESGTPQGGIISPVLANMTLDGLERALQQRFGATQRQRSQHKVHLVRYADDVIITGATRAGLENEVCPVVEQFLAARGRMLSPTKTRITHISEGFDFLGQHLRKLGDKLIISPSKKSVQAILDKVKAVIQAHPQANAGSLIAQLNPLIRGWANYHRHVVSKDTFSTVDWHIHGMVRRWVRKQHRRKSAAWVRERYFKTVGNQHWVFTGEVRAAQTPNGRGKQTVHLYQAAKTPIVRHRKIQGAANPYDLAWEVYFEERQAYRIKDSLRGRRQELQLWLEQAGKCPVCGQGLAEKEDWHTHHICSQVEGGTDTLDNLVLVHRNCHRQIHSRGWRVAKPRPVTRAFGEA